MCIPKCGSLGFLRWLLQPFSASFSTSGSTSSHVWPARQACSVTLIMANGLTAEVFGTVLLLKMKSSYERRLTPAPTICNVLDDPSGTLRRLLMEQLFPEFYANMCNLAESYYSSRRSSKVHPSPSDIVRKQHLWWLCSPNCFPTSLNAEQVADPGAQVAL